MLAFDIERCYHLLNLKQHCTDLELRKRYRQYALQYHPDKNHNHALEQDEHPQGNPFMEMQEAYERIVKYRKTKAIRKQYQQQQPQTDKYSEEKGESPHVDWKMMKERVQARNRSILKDLASFQHLEMDEGFSQLYQEHMDIMDAIASRLQQMRT